MMNKYRATFKISQIKAETEKAMLIKAPKSRRCFWIPKSLIRFYHHEYSFAIFDDFSYRTEKGELFTYSEIIDLFGKNIRTNYYNKPEKLEAKRRIFRYGQKHNVNYYMMTGDVGLEQLINNNVKRKNHLLDIFKKASDKEKLELVNEL